MKKTERDVDPIGDLEGLVFDTLRETTSAARRLVFLCRLNETLALALANARGEESSARLCKILALEAAARGKGPKEKDVALPRRRARKGEKRGAS